MGINHELLLNNIEEEYPDQVNLAAREIFEHPEIVPEVKMNYLRQLCEGDQEAEELLEEMREYFYRYTQDVCEHQRLRSDGIQDNLELIRERDVARSALHNAMIDSVRIFGRKIGSNNKDVNWLISLENRGRPAYARLALLTTFLDIVNKQKQE